MRGSWCVSWPWCLCYSCKDMKGGDKNQQMLQASVFISSVRPMACTSGPSPMEQHGQRTQRDPLTDSHIHGQKATLGPSYPAMSAQLKDNPNSHCTHHSLLTHHLCFTQTTHTPYTQFTLTCLLHLTCHPMARVIHSLHVIHTPHAVIHDDLNLSRTFPPVIFCICSNFSFHMANALSQNDRHFQDPR